MLMADKPERFISPERSISGPGTSEARSGTSIWLCESTPIELATIAATQGSKSSKETAKARFRKKTEPAPAMAKVLINFRRFQFESLFTIAV